MHEVEHKLDHLMADVTNLVRVTFVVPIGNSDHCSLSAVISMAQFFPDFCVSRKVFRKHQVNLNKVDSQLEYSSALA